MSRSEETLQDLSLARGTLDRAAARRKDPELVQTLLKDPATLVLELCGGACPVAIVDQETHLVLRPPRESDGERLVVFLGEDGDHTTYLGSVAPRGEIEARDGLWSTLREVGGTLGDRDAGLFTTLLALANWHRNHTHCPRCGAPTGPSQGGWVRRCTRDESEHYPRTDPAVIMSVTDAEDRLLLARGPAWPDGRYSVLAGFLEPGESFEAAVAREVDEEVGLVVDEVRYLGNQPWPFPCSLMVGFTARVAAGGLDFADGEIVEARWVTREELAAGLAAGAIGISARLSIARHLIEHWYGGPLQQRVEWTSVRTSGQR